jgi:hypothetical protein
VACARIPHHGTGAGAATRHQLVRDRPGTTEAEVVGTCTTHALVSPSSQVVHAMGSRAEATGWAAHDVRPQHTHFLGLGASCCESTVGKQARPARTGRAGGGGRGTRSAPPGGLSVAAAARDASLSSGRLQFQSSKATPSGPHKDTRLDQPCLNCPGPSRSPAKVHRSWRHCGTRSDSLRKKQRCRWR